MHHLLNAMLSSMFLSTDLSLRLAPWPIRLYVIENGIMQFISAPTDCAHDVSELRTWLEKRHESNNSC